MPDTNAVIFEQQEARPARMMAEILALGLEARGMRAASDEVRRLAFALTGLRHHDDFQEERTTPAARPADVGAADNRTVAEIETPAFPPPTSFEPTAPPPAAHSRPRRKR